MLIARQLTVTTAFIFFCFSAFAQQTPANSLFATGEINDLKTSLQTIVESINKTEEEIAQKRQIVRESESPDEALQAEIEALDDQLDALQENFAEIATKVDLSRFESVDDTKPLTWDEELKSLLNPLVHSLVKLTSRPREIEQLREDRRVLQEQKDAAKKGLSRLVQLQEAWQPEDEEQATPPVVEALEQEAEAWQKRLSKIDTEITITQQKLEQLLSQKSSLGDSFHNLFNLFFRSRGRNLFLALAGMLVFWLVTYRIFLIVQSTGFLQRYRDTFRFRLFNVGFVIIAFLGGILLFLFILFLFGDWLLLTLGILALLGVAWTSKHAIATYWAQMMLLLNVGPVREGERLELNGLPWLVRRLNFFTILENPLLDSGKLRLPISDMPDLRSKPFDKNDPWFPTRKDDWIVYGDDSHAKVVQQTPDFVRLVFLGNGIQIFPTQDFLGMAPMVLSNGYRCSIAFGLDYADQAQMTEAIPEAMHKVVVEGLQSAGYDEEKVKLNVEFAEAGGSSLDLAIIADFDGSCAREYKKLKRLLAKLCVDACNQHDWNIPFPQLSVHLEKPDAEEAPDPDA